MAYPTRAELVAASSVDALTDLTTDQQDALRAAAIVAVEDYTGQSFTTFVGERVIPGNGGTELYLDRRLEAFTAFEIDGVPLDDLTVVSLTEDFAKLYFPTPVPSYGVITPEMWGEAPRRFKGDLTITGTWGWTTCPDAVETALRYDMEDSAIADAHDLSATIHASRKLGIETISQGNLDLTLRDAPTLSPRVTRLLEPYVWLGRGGHLV